MSDEQKTAIERHAQSALLGILAFLAVMVWNEVSSMRLAIAGTVSEVRLIQQSLDGVKISLKDMSEQQRAERVKAEAWRQEMERRMQSIEREQAVIKAKR